MEWVSRENGGKGIGDSEYWQLWCFPVKEREKLNLEQVQGKERRFFVVGWFD